ncbi:MAG: tripartite tricarboxylate transporter permease [Chloroflexota bacterium]
MNMFDAIIAGFVALMTPQALIFSFLGVVYGLVIGILPGLGGIVAMTLLLPFTLGFEPAAFLAMLLGAHIGTIWGDSVCSILFGIPGAAKALPLMFDGHPMTLRGEGERALGASAMAALLGSLVGALFLALCIPIIRPLILLLGPSELLIMALWGLTVIATFSEGSVLKGLTAACAGVLVSFIGMDPVTATPRFTFGSLYLLDGLYFPVTVIGIFAVAEMMKLFLKGEAMVPRNVVKNVSTVWTGVMDNFRHFWLVVRASILGLWIGVLPGIGASTGSIAAYAMAMQTSKHPETFGKGNVEGVIAPDATLGANEGGGLLPTLAFGIPGGDSMALLLIAFYNMGISPGPQMLTQHLDMVFTLVWIVILASLMVAVIGIAVSPYLARIPNISANLMVPFVLSICFLGAFTVRSRIADVMVAGMFGGIGYLMDKFHYSRSNFVIGMVLATMIERSLHISITLYGKYFVFTRPMTLILLLALIVTTAWPFVRNWRRQRATKPPTLNEGDPQ